VAIPNVPLRWHTIRERLCYSSLLNGIIGISAHLVLAYMVHSEPQVCKACSQHGKSKNFEIQILSYV
jgi:hypothetical protein